MRFDSKRYVAAVKSDEVNPQTENPEGWLTKEFLLLLVQMVNLEFIDLRMNLLDDIPPELLQIAKLRILKLGSNVFEKIPFVRLFCGGSVVSKYLPNQKPIELNKTIIYII